MLLAATAIFLYYTAWTLLMVRSILFCFSRTYYIHSSNTVLVTALCGQYPSSPGPLPSSRVGHPYPRDLDVAWVRRGWHLHRHCHDQQQQEEGSQGKGSCCEEEDLIYSMASGGSFVPDRAPSPVSTSSNRRKRPFLNKQMQTK